MIYRYMFYGYYNNIEVDYLNKKEVITASVAIFKDKMFLYYESKADNVKPENVVNTDMIPFQNGDKWFRMMEIFHYYQPENDVKWERKITEKKHVFNVNYLNEDKVGSYIFLHHEHQEGNQYDVDKYVSIFICGNMIVLYEEEPREIVTLEDIRGKMHIPCRADWTELMGEHFKEWEDGKKGWKKLQEKGELL